MASRLAHDAIGLIGLGRMGTPIAHRLLAAGYPLTVWDRAPERVACLIAAGAVAASSPSDFAGIATVISIVLDDEGTMEVAAGLLDILGSGAVHVVMATISPDTAERLAGMHGGHGQHFLAAPVFGRPDAAAAGRLSINCSGNREAFERACGGLAHLGSARWIGEVAGHAMLLKIIGNNMIFAGVEMMNEMFDLLAAGGIAPPEAKRYLVDELLPGPIFSGYAERRLSDDGATDLRGVSGKDNQLCLACGDMLNVELPLVRALGDTLFGGRD
jgi:3-hydroxyisobutyrate dehydrogenase-like beta-hydroxyacid dehydrogenase